MSSKEKKGREGETPALKNPIFVDNMLQSGLQDFQITWVAVPVFTFKFLIFREKMQISSKKSVIIRIPYFRIFLITAITNFTFPNLKIFLDFYSLFKIQPEKYTLKLSLKCKHCYKKGSILSYEVPLRQLFGDNICKRFFFKRKQRKLGY